MYYCRRNLRGGDFLSLQKITLRGKTFDIVKNSDNFIQWYHPGRLDMETRAWKDDKIAPTLTTGCEKILILETRREDGQDKTKNKK